MPAGVEAGESLEDCDAQIALLEAKKKAIKAKQARDEANAKRNAGILAPNSPSPRKKPRLDVLPPSTSFREAKPQQPQFEYKALAAPSRFNEGMSTSRRKLEAANAQRDQPKAKGFERVAKREVHLPSPPRIRDDEDLTVIEDLQLGPRSHKPLAEDPTWQTWEPNSNTRLKSRQLAHDDLQEYLEDRYHITPSQLYSIVRPTRGGTEYEVPLENDWIVIGTLAEKSDIRTTNPSTVKIEADDDAVDAVGGLEGGQAGDGRQRGKRRAPPPRKAKKFVSFKLVDLGSNASSSGANVLNLLLFEADSAQYAETGDAVDEDMTTAAGVRMRREDTREVQQKRYIGGSYGAYERFWKESDGTLVALINPRLMKPRPTVPGAVASNIITVTPENAESMVVIGRARDLGHCKAVRRDGRECGAWCDTRIHTVCDFHVQEAVKRQRSGRSELLVGTAGVQVSTIGNRKKRADGATGRNADSSAPDYINKTGLLPATNTAVLDGQKSWVVSAPKAAAKQGLRPPLRQDGTFDAFRVRNNHERPGSKKSKHGREGQDGGHTAAIQHRLRQDGGKTVGGHYLKAAHLLQDKEGSKAEEGDTSTKRTFLARDIRKLGFNPTLRRDEAGPPAESTEANRQLIDGPSGIKRTIGRRKREHVSSDDDLLVMPPEQDAVPS